MQHELATQEVVSRIKEGDWIRTQVTPPSKPESGVFVVDSTHPRIDKGKPRQVTANVQEKGEGTRYLVFNDATRTASRAGTAMVWKYKLDKDGNPLPEIEYPECPTCGSTDPGCRTKDGAWAPKMHAARTKLPTRTVSAPTKVEVDGVEVAETRKVDVYQPVEPAKPDGVGTVLAEDLVAGLTAVLPMTADPKDALPMLASVKFETDGDELTLVSTDRYTLGTYRMAWDGGHVDATVAEPKDLLTFAKKAKIEGYLTLTFSKESVEVASASAKATYRLYDGEFPRWRMLLPTEDPGDVVFGVNPQMMARFAKAGDKFTPMRVSFRSPAKPVRVQIGEAFDGLIMPVRLPDEPERREPGTARINGTPVPPQVPEPRESEEDTDEAPVVAVTPITAVEKPVVTTDRCSVCKGYGVVRKYGEFKGTHYKTAKGAAEATAKGNSMPCPAEHGGKVAA
jgi:hypothetical protein